MSQSVTLSTLDDAVLVAQWETLLHNRPGSGLSEAVLRGELQQVAEWLHGALPPRDSAPLNVERLEAAGEQLVELGVDDMALLASAQAALAGWLAGSIPPPLLSETLTAFNQGAYRALQSRRHDGQQEEQRALSARFVAQRQYDTLLRDVQRSLEGSSSDESQSVGITLALLMRELRAQAACFFEQRRDGWHLEEFQGELPSPLLVQPGTGSAIGSDSQGTFQVLGDSFQLAAPVPVDPNRRGLLLVALAAPPPEPSALLGMLEQVGYTLGRALDGLSLRAIVATQLGELRTLSDGGGMQAWSLGAQQRLGLLIDEYDDLHRLAEPPMASLTVEPQRVVLPLTMRGELFGKVMLEDDELHEWSEDELELMSAVAEQMAQALEVARLFQESQRRSAQLEAAAEVSRAASSLLSLDDLMNAAVEQIRRTFGYYHVQVFLVDEEEEWAVLRSSTGEVGQKLLARGHRLAVGSKSIIGQVTATARPVAIRDTDAEVGPWSFNELLRNTRAELAVPLQVGHMVIGALDVQSLSPDVFYEEDIGVLQTLADQMAVAIQNARAYEQQKESAEQLRELDKLKSQFLASMSHELRTPLNSIIGFSRVILKGIDGPVTDLQKKDLTTIYNSGQILLQLIDSILDISKIEAGKMELDFEEVNLRQVIEVSLSTASGLVRDKPVELLREVPEDLPILRADPVRVRQVMLNLLSNASKFTEEGYIRLTATQMGDEIMISVSDTGLGIPPEKHPKLFEAFYQVDGSATRKVGGTGLGLAITKSFVEMHGGQIWVESSGVPGEGTTFTFTLPIDGPPQDQEEGSVAPLVLAVDDEPGITMLYERYITPEGYRFVACHSPVEALEKAAELQPHMILLDLRMPEMDGFQVLEALRRKTLTSDIPVVVCSIETIQDIEQQALNAGATDFLQKPVLRQDLISAVQRWAGSPAGAKT